MFAGELPQRAHRLLERTIDLVVGAADRAQLDLEAGAAAERQGPHPADTERRRRAPGRDDRDPSSPEVLEEIGQERLDRFNHESITAYARGIQVVVAIVAGSAKNR